MVPTTCKRQETMFFEMVEKPLDGDQLQLINRIKNQSLHEVNEENEECRLVYKNDKSAQQAQSDPSFDDWNTDSCTVKTPHETNELFMYNFFRRRNCTDRTTLYLSKIESMKGEKIRNVVSKIRKVPLAFIPLPQEKIGAEESRKREMKHRGAKEWAKSQRLEKNELRMKLRLFVVLLVFATTATAVDKPPVDVNPEDVDDVKPPVEEEKDELPEKMTPPATTLLSSTSNTTEVASPFSNVTNSSVISAQKSDIDKKEELLTGKEEAAAAKVESAHEATTVAVETLPPIIPKAEDVKEDEKENAAPEFEAKQEVEGGKGEEDPDANVDKPAAVDPPKDEADGAAKEDRETPAVGAEGLHEAVEEARGNPAPGVPVVDKKKDSADEEQTLEAAPVARPHRFDSSKEFEASFQRIQGSEEESTGFMSFFFFASFFIIIAYLVQHNKKKIFGLIFEGRSGRNSSRRSGGNVRYRRLSQNESGN